MAVVTTGARLTGAARGGRAGELKRRYGKGERIRALADSDNCSYGFVHQVLTDSGCHAAQVRWRTPARGRAPAGGL
ncbi:MAG: helix-turn-helix domain-containing protein [Jatrophihabitantaceae bacterium]